MYLDEAEMVLSLGVTAKRKRSFSFSFHLVRRYWICRLVWDPTSSDILSVSSPETRWQIRWALESDKTFARQPLPHGCGYRRLKARLDSIIRSTRRRSSLASRAIIFYLRKGTQRTRANSENGGFILKNSFVYLVPGSSDSDITGSISESVARGDENWSPRIKWIAMYHTERREEENFLLNSSFAVVVVVLFSNLGKSLRAWRQQRRIFLLLWLSEAYYIANYKKGEERMRSVGEERGIQ